MSVPVGQRGKSKLEAHVKVEELVLHTLTITSNPSVFLDRNRALTKLVNECVVGIGRDVWQANLVRVGSDPRKWRRRREIMAIPFRDRVVQRSYNDNAIYPCMSRGWIYDNAACQEGKGTDFARRRMRCHLERHARRHGTNGGILIVDVRGYYAHLRMDVMERRFRRACPRWVADFAVSTMRNQYGDGPGVNPGSQLAQIAGVDYLDPIDHAIKEHMGIRGYVRYMDDLVLVHESMGHLRDCLSDIAERLGAIGLEPHPHKTRIIRAGERFAFLGFDWRLADDGHAVMTLRKESVKRMRRGKRRLHALESQGLRLEGTTRTSYEGWRAHAAKGDNPGLLENSDKWFDRLERS